VEGDHGSKDRLTTTHQRNAQEKGRQ
jgi:hypothetical protein